jgi:hypothetical protein
MTADDMRQLAIDRKYKPVEVHQWHGRFVVLCKARAGITGKTLDRRWKGSGWWASQFGYDPINDVHDFVLRKGE